MITGYQGNLQPNVTATIPISTATSGTVSKVGFSLVGIYIPSAFTGTSISFLGNYQSTGTFSPVYNSSGLVSYSVTAGNFIAINPADLQGVPYIQILSNATELAARTLTLSLKGI